MCVCQCEAGWEEITGCAAVCVIDLGFKEVGGREYESLLVDTIDICPCLNDRLSTITYPAGLTLTVFLCMCV